MKQFSAIALYTMQFLTVLSCGHSVREFRETAADDYGFAADSIDYTIEAAKKVWESRHWRKEYGDAVFTDYILPPVAAKEPVEFYWRSDLPRRMDVVICDTADVAGAARTINGKIDVITKNEAWGNPQLSYSEIMSGKFAKCDDRSTLAVLAMRAYGIPAAFEYVPNWGDTNNGHSFCSVILPDDSLLVFQERNDDGIHIQYSHKVPKVYRKSFFPDDRSPLAGHVKAGEYVPQEFSDIFIEDVTRFHSVGQCDVTLSTGRPDDRLAYLCVFTPKGWKPAAYAEMNDGRATFIDVGNGGGYDFRKMGDSLGDGILYLPAVYEDGRIEPAGFPFILSASGKRDIVSGRSRETVTLTRKYPRFGRVVRFASFMTGGIFEASGRADFADADCLHRIIDTPISRMQLEDSEETGRTYRYARYRKPKGTFSISELVFFDDDGNEIEGEPFVPGYIESSDVSAVYDGNPLTYFEIDGVVDFWAGVKFDAPSKIGKVGFCPRTDDNGISPGDEYELMYWDSGWESLGRKTAADYALTFDGVPCGALLWLRNLTKGREERPFTYENGKQMWW